VGTISLSTRRNSLFTLVAALVRLCSFAERLAAAANRLLLLGIGAVLAPGSKVPSFGLVGLEAGAVRVDCTFQLKVFGICLVERNALFCRGFGSESHYLLGQVHLSLGS